MPPTCSYQPAAVRVLGNLYHRHSAKGKNWNRASFLSCLVFFFFYLVWPELGAASALCVVVIKTAAKETVSFLRSIRGIQLTIMPASRSLWSRSSSTWPGIKRPSGNYRLFPPCRTSHHRRASVCVCSATPLPDDPPV